MWKKLKHSKLIALILAMGVISVTFMSAAGQTNVTQTPRSYTDGEKAKVKGVIIGRDGDLVTLRDKDDAVTSAVLGNTTKVQSPTGLLRLRKKNRAVTNLIPGLRIEVEGRGNTQGQLAADKIIFDSDDLQLAQTISGGVAPVEAEVAQLKGQQQKLEGQQTEMQARQQKLEGQQTELQAQQQQLRSRQVEMQGQQQQMSQDLQRTQQETAMLGKRVSELDDYDAKFTAIVNFATGKAALTPEAKIALDDIADKALNTQGYLIEVAGYCDITGAESLNQQLSRRRAESVVSYLEEVKQVPLRRVLTPSGLGTSQPIAPNDTAAGRAQNRRAEVKILVNRALAQK